MSIALAVGALALSGCSSGGERTAPAPTASSPYANVDAENTRSLPSAIRAETVDGLEFAWSLPIDARGSDYGGHMASPVVADGVVYSQDQDSNVQAIDLRSGELIWEKSYNAPASGPNGVIAAAGRIYGATPTGAFALDPESGEEVWSATLVRNRSEQITMAPGYEDGLVYSSTGPGEKEGNEVGVLWALDAKSGKRVWRFDTVPKSLWGRPELNYGGGTSYAPAFDGRGSMYVGTGNAGPIPGTPRHPWGSSRPGPNLYTDSVLKLDAKTGKLRWHYQLSPHGICDWDVGAPLLLEAQGRELVVAAARSGVVVALDPETGKPVWRRAVGIHNGHDDDGLISMRGEYSRLKLPMTAYPGRFGGVFSPMAVSGSTVFVPVIDWGTELVTQLGARQVGRAAGELVALDAGSGAVRWQQDLPSPLFGAVTATNDLVFATTVDGSVYAFDVDSGQAVWRKSLPAAINAGLAIGGDTLLAPAGYDDEGNLGEVYAGADPTPALVAYRLQD